MAYDYEALYAAEPDALGGQTAAIATILTQVLPERARVLDVGCGQGRDALPLARSGHRVTGVDLAPSGVAAMVEAAAAEGLKITGEVEDITTYRPDGPFDIILIDRTLHMLEDATQRTVLHRLIGEIAPQGWLVIADEAKNLPAFEDVLTQDDRQWQITRAGKTILTAQRID